MVGNDAPKGLDDALVAGRDITTVTGDAVDAVIAAMQEAAGVGIAPEAAVPDCEAAADA